MKNFIFLLPILLLGCILAPRDNIFDPNSPNFLGNTNPELYNAIVLNKDQLGDCVQEECIIALQELQKKIYVTIDNIPNKSLFVEPRIYLEGYYFSIEELLFVTIKHGSIVPQININTSTDRWFSQIELIPGQNIIKVIVGDISGNTYTTYLDVYLAFSQPDAVKN